MDIKAILLVGGNEGIRATEMFGGIPLAYLDVLGLPVVERVLQRLQHFGVCDTTLISESAGQARILRSAAR